MIISASRRTDIPAFYGEWFINRIRAGTCVTANPFNPAQVQRLSLAPEDVDLIVFWTRDSSRFQPHLPELSDRGYHFYFQYTLTGYGIELEPNCPYWETSISTFRELSDSIGSGKVLWRYDPIIIGGRYSPDFHAANFRRLAEGLRGSTQRVTISLVDNYKKATRRMGCLLEPPDEVCELVPMLRELVSIASENDMSIFSCCEPELADLAGISQGACIDGSYIKSELCLDISAGKDKNQRNGCKCLQSKDIGSYNTCLHGCLYCYATTSHGAAEIRHKSHDPLGERLI